MFSSTRTNEISQHDRAGFTIFTSALVHVVVIMGIGFSYELNQRRPDLAPSIDTTLATSQQNSDEPEDSDLFAATNQAGGGLANEDSQISSPLPALNYPTTRAAREREQKQRSGKARDRIFIYRNLPDSLVLGAEDPSRLKQQLNQNTGEEQVAAMLNSPLRAELDRQLKLGQQFDRQKFISSRTREHKYASYMESWRNRVEQIGNLNYPDEARRRKLSGSLVLTVTINSDGSLEQVNIIRSSGQKILDDAARRIVQMAAPYPEFPQSILEDADRIHITRTWQFLHNSTLIKN